MASNIEQTKSSSDPEKSSLFQKLLQGLFNSSDRPKTAGEFGLAVLKAVPTGLVLMRSFMKEVNWKQAQGDVQKGLDNTIVIVGQPNTGKSTLFNTLKGEQLSPVSSEAGTTLSLVRSTFGPFILIDTPGHLPELMKNGIDEATVVVLLIDATKGLQDKDKELYGAISNAKKTAIVAVNKVDMLKSVAEGDRAASEAAVALGVAGIIPISGRTGQNVAEELIPTMIEASPEAALVIGRELPAYRRAAAQRVIRNSTLLSLAAGLEPVPLVDIPILLGTQMRLVLRIAALYGEPMDSSDAMKHARELIATAASGAGMRILAEQAAKAVPFGGDFIAGAIAGAATWAIGQVALEYYDSGKQLNPGRLRQLYTGFYHRFRRSRTTEQLHTYAIEGDDRPLAIEAPKTTNEK